MIFALLVSVALSTITVQPDFRNIGISEATVSFATFKAHFQKEYGSPAEEAHRRRIYLDNVDTIIAHNEKDLGWTMGVNEFADMSPNEFYATYLNNTFNHVQKNVKKLDTDKTPNAVNWVNAGAVTPVKNQGSCGSCWAFSSTGALEGAWQIKYGELTSLSEQQLVACDSSDNGCQGGLMDFAFRWIQQNGGIASEEAYPYTAGNGQRGRCYSSGSVATVSGYTDVYRNNVDQFKAALSLGPLSVAVEADRSAWQFYSGGVMNSESCGTQLDHGVLAVGFDSTYGYFNVKNSWGSTWGESGYIRLADSSRNSAGICGILSQASYPTAGSRPQN